MKTSVIRQRVADFLRLHSPFEAFSEEDLLELAGSGRVKFHQSGEYIFRQADTKVPLVWVIQQGQVEVFDEHASSDPLRDLLGPGDLIGLERFGGNGHVVYSLRTASDVILYGVDAALFESLIPRYPVVKRFLKAHFSVSGIAGSNRISWLDAEAPPLNFLQARLVVVPSRASAVELASRLRCARNGVVAVIDGDGKIGTVSAAEICDAMAASTHPIPKPCPVTAASSLSTRTAVREMIRARRQELAITSAGTLDSPLEGILTASELAMFCGHNPIGLLSGICESGSGAEVVPLVRQAERLVLEALAQPQDVEDCGRICAEFTAAVGECAIGLSQRALLDGGRQLPAVPYCWLLFGAAARGEVLVPAAPSIATVYDDSHHAFRTEDASYFSAVTAEAIALFERCGLKNKNSWWPEGVQRSMPIQEWKRLYGETIGNPLGHDLYARREFFDCAPLVGDHSIPRELWSHILVKLQEHEVTIPLLANDTLAHLPPLTFFGGMVLELDGAKSESLDIRGTVMSPIADAARVFAFAKRQFTRANTLERLRAAAQDFPDGAQIFRESEDAFRVALYYLALSGEDRVDPRKLRKFDQLLLKKAFSCVQRLLEFTVSTFIPSS